MEPTKFTKSEYCYLFVNPCLAICPYDINTAIISENQDCGGWRQVAFCYISGVLLIFVVYLTIISSCLGAGRERWHLIPRKGFRASSIVDLITQHDSLEREYVILDRHAYFYKGIR